MKKSFLNLIGFQIIFCGLLIFISVPYHSCKPDDGGIDSLPVVKKPNIYLYPTETSQIRVNLSFPLGGKIITSIPDYGNGWTVDVDTSGIINKIFKNLFYESIQPNVWQLTEGWTIKRSELEIFFTDNLSKHRFYGREIKDFLDYWIPRLNDYEYYEIYPQESNIIETVIKLEISKTPDNILRLFYLIKGVNDNSNNKLNIPNEDFKFQRSGFYVTEWGVILK